MQVMPETTKVVKAHSKYNVLRTSIPAAVRNALELKEGDNLKWSIVAKDSRVTVEVQKE